MAANVFLLTHKCGNNFIEDLFNRGDNKIDTYIELKRSMSGFTYNRECFLNIRCRNFNKAATKSTLSLVGKENTKYFIFTRHPASFFRSAARYHFRSGEKWSKSNKLQHFGGKTLHQRLHDCATFGEQLVVSMKHFGIEKRMPNNWIENLAYLRDQGADCQQVKCEDIWQDINALKEFHSSIVHSGFSIDFEQILGVSPLGTEISKKSHGTGEFKKDAFADYDDFARNFYDANFRSFEGILQY